MIKANVIIGHYQWKRKIKNPNNYFKNKLKRILKLPFFRKKKQEFSIFLTNNKEMKNLNYKFRKKNKTTDVLSFPFNHIIKKNVYIGDIAIGYEIIDKRSKVSDFNYEFDKMWIHGYLHLIGYDHKKNKEYKKMKNKEKLIINFLNC